MFSYHSLFSSNSKNVSKKSHNPHYNTQNNDQELFDHWMGSKEINYQDSHHGNIIFSSLLANQIIKFSEQEKLSFTIFFPDGEKAKVVIQDWPGRVELRIRSSNIRLNRRLKNSGKKTKQQLENYFRKPTFLLIHDDY